MTVATRVWPQPGYPFLLDVTAAYALDADGLSVTLTGRNAGDEALPYGVGQHPYVTAGSDLVDDAVLTVPAAAWLRTDERGLPVSTEPVDGTPWDFRAGRQIGDTVLDTPFTELDRDGEGRVVVRLALVDGTHGVDVWGGARHRLSAGVLRGHAGAGPATPRTGGRADVLPGGRVQQRGRPGDPRAGPRTHSAVGSARLVRWLGLDGEGECPGCAKVAGRVGGARTRKT